MLFKYLYGVCAHLPTILRERNLGAADRAMRFKELEIRVLGETIRLPGSHFGAAREMYGRLVYFPTEAFRIARGSTVIDLGCNEGLFAVLAAKRASRVIAVDAQSQFEKDLYKHAKANECDGRIVFVLALVGGTSGVFSDEMRLSSGSHYRVSPPALSMAALLEKYQVGVVDFLKIDIEGSEFSLFSDDLAWLSRVRLIAMEVHPAFGDPRAIENALEEHGFRSFLLSEDQNRVEKLATRGAYLYAVNERFQGKT